MSDDATFWSRIHSEGAPWPFSALLGLLSCIYLACVKLRLRSYRMGLLRSRSLPGRVISIGNITAGGTGKTPAVIMVARWAMQKGLSVVVLSRGYGGRYREKVFEVSDGRSIKARESEAGDEPMLLAGALPGVPVILARKRYLAGRYAHTRYRPDLYILDDGFQHIALRRDLDILLMDAKRPVGNGFLLPKGPLREPMSSLERAGAIVFTRAGRSEGDLPSFDLPDIPCFRAEHVPDEVIYPLRHRMEPPQVLEGKNVVAFAGIGNPGSFVKSLEEIGAHVAGFRPFGDHHAFTPRQLHQLIDEAEKMDADCLVTTEKDWERIQSIWPSWPSIAFLRIRFEIISHADAFFRILEDVFKA